MTLSYKLIMLFVINQYKLLKILNSDSDISSSHSSAPQNTSPIIDLIEAPDLTEFYHRNTELTTLKQWIFKDQIR